jgi:DNA-binding MarR family transcriptional regulator
MTERRPAAARGANRTIRELLSFRLHVVANLLSRGAELRYRREHSVSLWEWRTIALLGVSAPLSLNDLARAAGVDKAQMSRVVSGLTARELVSRDADIRDARAIRLALTAEGRKLYKGLIRSAVARDSAFLESLSAQEQKVLDGALSKLAHRAREFIRQEKATG